MVAGSPAAAGLLVLSASPAAGLTPYAWLAAGAAPRGIGMGITAAANNATSSSRPSTARWWLGCAACSADRRDRRGLSHLRHPGPERRPRAGPGPVFLIFAVVLAAMLPADRDRPRPPRQLVARPARGKPPAAVPLTLFSGLRGCRANPVPRPRSRGRPRPPRSAYRPNDPSFGTAVRGSARRGQQVWDRVVGTRAADLISTQAPWWRFNAFVTAPGTVCG